MLRALQRYLGTRHVPVFGVNFGRGRLPDVDRRGPSSRSGLTRVFAGELRGRRAADARGRGRTASAHVRSTTSSSRARRSAGWSSSAGGRRRGPRHAAVRRRDLRDALGLDRVQPLERRPGARVGARRDGGDVHRAALAARAAARRAARPRRRRSRTGRPTCHAAVLVDGHPVGELGAGEQVYVRLGEQRDALLAHASRGDVLPPLPRHLCFVGSGSRTSC